ncbi:GIY-YIG nuclease family protein [Candidatus Saccharibacteria bacterium]|nr:GIY-YIG nuclease family protein [Candidatus Saccharibacteria bacterium]
MKSIKFIDFLDFPDEELKKLKLVFNSNWTYVPSGRSDYVREIFGEEEKYLDLLEMYRQNKVELVKSSTRLHDPNNKRFINGELAFCFIPYDTEDWLLVNAFKVLDDSEKLIDVDEAAMADYQQYFGRLVITWKDRSTRNVRMKSIENIEKLTVKTILEEPYNEVAETFPGYENINLSWEDLNRVLKLKTWRTAFENQKGVYLITDTLTNKRYVGSAYGDNMILGRWQDYAKNGHGGNKLLKELVTDEGLDYVKRNFRYSILDIYKSSVDDETIIRRESWWKEVLLTRNPEFGYNDN